VGGGFIQRSTGVLELQLGGRKAGDSYDQLVSSMSFGIGGTLTVSRVKGFAPTNGDSFLLVSFPVSVGSNFNGVNLPAGYTWAVSYLSSGILATVTSVDAVTNGVPKAWLTDFGWTNNLDQAAMNDADRDGLPTWAEFYAGTDPTSPASCLRMSGIGSGPAGGVSVAWQSAEGRRYSLLRSPGLLAGSPTNVVVTNLLATPPLNTATDSTARQAIEFYRLRLE
jgi:hypothetical protein